MQAELLAIIVVYWTLGWRLRGRPVVHWCDNTGAIAAAIGGGGARFPGAGVLTCMLHLVLLHLRYDSSTRLVHLHIRVHVVVVQCVAS